MSSSETTPAAAGSRLRRAPGLPMGFIAAAVAVVLGVGGLVVGAREGTTQGAPDAAPGAAAPSSASAPVNGTTVGDLSVYDAYIRQPASPDVAAAYLTVRNAGDAADRLSSAYCGAATRTSVHADSGAMRAGEQAPSTPLDVPADSTVSLRPAKGHIMLDKLTGTLRAGDTVSLLLRFDRAGQVLLDVPVISITAPAPGGATS